MVLLLAVVLLVALNRVDDSYTREQLISDMKAERVREVEVHPNIKLEH